jgi:hypothetical protein
MRIEWAIPCRYCEVVNGEITMVGGLAGLFTVPELPIEIGVWIVLLLAAPGVEAGPDVPHTFNAWVLDPQMEEIEGTRVEIAEFNLTPPALPGWEAEEAAPSFHRFAAEAEGTYTVEMRVDDRAKTVPITVRVAADDAEATTS